MSEISNSTQNEKAAKIRRKPERESALSPTLAVARQATNDRHQGQSSGGGLLQRQCGCGQHTIAGGVCDQCRQKQQVSLLSQPVTDPISNNFISNDINEISTYPKRDPLYNFSRIPVHSSPPFLQRNPDVGFTVHNLNRTPGRLDDPSDDGTGTVSWPLSFSVTSPLEAEADVEVTGSSSDPCSDYEVGFLQTVHSQWLRVYYWGQNRGDGSTIARATVSLPIRDGDPSSMWYASTSHGAPAGCNTHVNPTMDDYPTLFSLQKVHHNSLTGRPNYLTGVRRGIHFVTTLVASTPTGIQPLRHFYWNYWMSIDFQPNYTNPNTAWSFTWLTNRTSLGRVRTGRDGAVPLFTSATTPYNASLSWASPQERP